MPSDFDKMHAALDEWSEWMKSYSQNLGFPAKVPILSGGHSASPTFEEALGDVDGRRMKTIEACVDGLPPASFGAVYRKYDICSVWRHGRPGYTFDMALADAYSQLLPVFKRRDVIL
jgi:hypothetical protein